MNYKSNFYFHYYYVVRPILLARYNYCNFLCMPKLNKIVLNVTLDNQKKFEEIRLVYAFILLQILAMRRPYVKLVKPVYRVKKKFFILVLNLDLSNSKDVFIFSSFLINYIIPALSAKYTDIRSTVNPSNFAHSFSFSDVGFFEDIPPSFYKWVININVTVLFNRFTKARLKAINNQDMRDLYVLLGFPKLKK